LKKEDKQQNGQKQKDKIKVHSMIYKPQYRNRRLSNMNPAKNQGVNLVATEYVLLRVFCTDL